MTTPPARWLAAAVLLAALPAAAEPVPDTDGAVRARGDGFELYDAGAGRWLDPEAFWLAHAARRGGLTWGRGRDYPPYDEVREHDTFLVETDHGPCLMEFFHQRWRRANDVWRWSARYDDYGGCARVFD